MGYTSTVGSAGLYKLPGGQDSGLPLSGFLWAALAAGGRGRAG